MIIISWDISSVRLANTETIIVYTRIPIWSDNPGAGIRRGTVQGAMKITFLIVIIDKSVSDKSEKKIYYHVHYFIIHRFIIIR